MRRSADLHTERAGDSTWWRDAVFYQVYLPSFADADSDGIGDLAGLRSRLGYLELLGIDAIQLTGAPGDDDLAHFDKLVQDAREHSLRIVLDLGSYPRLPPDLAETLRFWSEGGVDGFRIVLGDQGEQLNAAHRMIREVVDEWPGRVVLGNPGPDPGSAGPHLDLNERLTQAEFDADLVRQAIEQSLAVAGPRVTWALSHPDAVRHLTRYGGGRVGGTRARAMALVLLALPGAIFLYNGEELGLPNVELPDWAVRDPVWAQSGATNSAGRDGARVPMPWEGTAPPFGFTAGQAGWLPMPEEWASLTVEAQLEDSESMLSLYRQAIELRGQHAGFRGEEVEWYGAPPGCFAFRRRGGGLVCALNTSGAPVPVPDGEVLLSSAPLRDGQLPPDAAIWLV